MTTKTIQECACETCQGSACRCPASNPATGSCGASCGCAEGCRCAPACKCAEVTTGRA
jgi:hypothetical protein